MRAPAAPGGRVLLAAAVLVLVVAVWAVQVADAQKQLLGEHYEKKEGRCAQDNPHPKPFKPKKKLAFCHEYQGRSCCDRKLTKSIKASVDALVDPACANCYTVVSDYKCAECSPDSAMFHEGLKSQIRFCWDYCLAIFNTCKDIPLSTGDDPFYLNEGGMTAEDWCADKVDEEPYCFRGFIPTERDTACLCPSHDCHLSPPPVKHAGDEL